MAPIFEELMSALKVLERTPVPNEMEIDKQFLP
jgi:hypothetical protein